MRWGKTKPRPPGLPARSLTCILQAPHRWRWTVEKLASTQGRGEGCDYSPQLLHPLPPITLRFGSTCSKRLLTMSRIMAYCAGLVEISRSWWMSVKVSTAPGRREGGRRRSRDTGTHGGAILQVLRHWHNGVEGPRLSEENTCSGKQKDAGLIPGISSERFSNGRCCDSGLAAARVDNADITLNKTAQSSGTTTP